MERFFTYKKGSIYYTDNGTGSVIVLLHGYLESSEVWNGFGDKLATGFRVIAVDLPGHGRSGIYGETHTMEFLATAVKELLDSLAVRKVFLLGHSMGGYVTLAFLELFTDYLTGYCLFHSHPFSDSAEALAKRKSEIEIVSEGNKELMCPENVTRMFAPGNTDFFPDQFRKLKQIALANKGEGIISLLKGMMIRPSRLEFVEAGKVPFLWLLGLKDNYIPCNEMQTKVKLPPNAKVIVLNNSGHLGFIEEEDNALVAVSEFAGDLTI